jgi:endonuclease/exonuclease/phosphatase family metal-dependent hydrolase
VRGWPGPGPLGLVMVVSLALVACSRPLPHRQGATAAEGPALRVMTFNLRYDNPGDGVNAWPNRKDRVAALIRYHQADLVGVQEALASQLVDLDGRLPEYSRVGVGRADGGTQGEFSAIFYRTDRLRVEESGTFWLSPTPEIAGSKGWDAAIERIVTWARVRDRRTGCRWLHLNTHFDHVGEVARAESARLIRQRLRSLAGDGAVVLTGDLNTDPTQLPYRILTRDTLDQSLPPLTDAFAASTSGSYGPTGTWNAFTAIDPNRRIDYIMVSAPIIVDVHAILSDRWDDRFPSDHLPVLAALRRFCR